MDGRQRRCRTQCHCVAVPWRSGESLPPASPQDSFAAAARVRQPAGQRRTRTGGSSSLFFCAVYRRPDIFQETRNEFIELDVAWHHDAARLLYLRRCCLCTGAIILRTCFALGCFSTKPLRRHRLLSFLRSCRISSTWSRVEPVAIRNAFIASSTEWQRSKFFGPKCGSDFNEIPAAWKSTASVMNRTA
jgi:hypothetical protein